MADKLIIDWKEYNLIVEKLAIQIHQNLLKERKQNLKDLNLVQQE